MIWAAGVQASSAAGWPDCGADRAGRAIVDGQLGIAGDEPIFVIGDTASQTPDGAAHPLPGLAPVAKQMGSYGGRVIKAGLRGRRKPAPFRYRNWGSMATIGRKKAIADFGWLKLSGFPAWIARSLTHVAFLDGFANRVSVSSNWHWSYLTRQHGARLILMPVQGAGGKDG